MTGKLVRYALLLVYLVASFIIVQYVIKSNYPQNSREKHTQQPTRDQLFDQEKSTADNNATVQSKQTVDDQTTDQSLEIADESLPEMEKYQHPVHIKSPEYETHPMIEAMHARNWVLFKSLLRQYRSDINSLLARGNTVLSDVLDANNSTALTILLTSDVDVNQTAYSLKYSARMTPIKIAARNNNVQAVRLLVNRGAKVNQKDADGKTALQYAVSQNSLNMMQSLLKANADVNAVDSSGNDSMHYIVSLDAAKLLIQYHADLNHADERGETPIFKQICSAHGKDYIQYYLDHGANVNTRNISGKTPLIFACEIGNTEVADTLIKHHADMSVKTKETEETALHMAIVCKKVHIRNIHGTVAYEHQYRDIIKMLIKHGAPLNATNRNKETPLFYAVRYNDMETLLLLINNGASITQPNVDGATVLHNAVWHNNPKCVKLLVEHGAPVNSKSRSGKTPLAIVLQNQQGQVTRELSYQNPTPTMRNNFARQRDASADIKAFLLSKGAKE